MTSAELCRSHNTLENIMDIIELTFIKEKLVDYIHFGLVRND